MNQNTFLLSMHRLRPFYHFIRIVPVISFILYLCLPVQAQRGRKRAGSFANKTEGLQKISGYFNAYYDQGQDKLYLEVSRFGEEFLYVNSLAAGLGSNDIGLDRGQLGETYVVRFERHGTKLMLVQVNYRYRAISDNGDERQAIEEAFPSAVLWGFPIVASGEGRVLVDASDFFLRDAHGVIDRLKEQKEGHYQVDLSRSSFYLPRTKAFPENAEYEVTLTYTGKAQGEALKSVVPNLESFSLRLHHSFIKLPGAGYQPRPFDPRAGYFGTSYFDYATPLGSPLEKRFIVRHRLQKQDPALVVSEAKEPIIYYLDRGTPEPMRSALMEGARWWNQAFEAIGYKGAFQVKLMPEGADPLDVRYNTIQWVHRSTRGWSYGASIVDPRTGEIIKGHVTLGSLRVRQDYLIAEALLAPYKDGDTNGSPKAMQEMALARLRQLAAHEVGHTLGLAHSYTSSSEGRSSVMDYPHPLVRLKGGQIDLSDAYDDKIGAWDKLAIAYGYQDFTPDVDQAEALVGFLKNAGEQGLTFLSDQDARPRSSAHPRTHLWDNGREPTAALKNVMAIRTKALNQFGKNNIQKGRPLATLEEVLVPLYFFHRYQMEAVVKLIGGLDYHYAMKGEERPATALLDPAVQWEGLGTLLSTLKAEQLALPESILTLIPPRPMGYDRHRELFPNRTGLTLDPYAGPQSWANFVFSLLLNPERANRIVVQHSRDGNQPDFSAVLDKISDSLLKVQEADGYHGELQYLIGQAYLEHLMRLATDGTAYPNTKALTLAEIKKIRSQASNGARGTGSGTTKARLSYRSQIIDRFLKNPGHRPQEKLPMPPPGSPIGSCDEATMY